MSLLASRTNILLSKICHSSQIVAIDNFIYIFQNSPEIYSYNIINGIKNYTEFSNITKQVKLYHVIQIADNSKIIIVIEHHILIFNTNTGSVNTLIKSKLLTGKYIKVNVSDILDIITIIGPFGLVIFHFNRIVYRNFQAVETYIIGKYVYYATATELCRYDIYNRKLIQVKIDKPLYLMDKFNNYLFVRFISTPPEVIICNENLEIINRYVNYMSVRSQYVITSYDNYPNQLLDSINNRLLLFLPFRNKLVFTRNTEHLLFIKTGNDNEGVIVYHVRYGYLGNFKEILNFFFNRIFENHNCSKLFIQGYDTLLVSDISHYYNKINLLLFLTGQFSLQSSVSKFTSSSIYEPKIMQMISNYIE